MHKYCIIQKFENPSEYKLTIGLWTSTFYQRLASITMDQGSWLIYEFRCLSDIKVLTFFFQLNKMSVGVDINSFDKYGRTIVCHFAAKCPR